MLRFGDRTETEWSLVMFAILDSCKGRASNGQSSGRGVLAERAVGIRNDDVAALKLLFKILVSAFLHLCLRRLCIRLSPRVHNKFVQFALFWEL